MICTGSRYIYDLYYEKEAISKQLYDWLLKNNYADANLIAKWKKQGYEKVRVFALRFIFILFQTQETNSWPLKSSAAYDVSRRRKRTSTPHVSAESPKPSSRRIRLFSASIVVVVVVRVVISQLMACCW